MKTVVLLNIFVEMVLIFSGLFYEWKVQKVSSYLNIILFNIINVFCVNLDQFNAS